MHRANHFEIHSHPVASSIRNQLEHLTELKRIRGVIDLKDGVHRAQQNEEDIM